MDMRAMRWMLLLLLMFVPQIALFTGGDAMSFPPVLSLERRVQLKATAVKQLMQLDMARHATGRRLTGEGQGTTGVVKLPVIGSTDNNVGSPYLTRVKLGSPPKEFTALVDTGSDTLWFTCRPCSGCPEPSGLSQRNFYDPWLSSTSTVIGCSDKWCSNLQSGGLAQTGLGFDGIVGMGPNRNRLSLNSQLNSLGISPMVFSLCLESSGNGVLVLNEAVDQRMVYTPLLESKSYYSLNLESISVNGEILPIDSSVFTSGQRKTIVDSGTTLAYFADQAYDPFINAVVAAVSPSVQTSVGNDGGPCFLASGSLDDSSFPPVTLNFANGAAMKLKPHNYLLPEILTGDQLIFCMGWKRQGSLKITVLGDIILMNKLVVHDLDNMRLGWVDYNCSSPVNVTTSHQWKRRHTNAGHASYTFTMSMHIVVAVFAAHMLTFYA